MNKLFKKAISVCIGAALLLSVTPAAFAADTYVDMPDDWRTTAIENAVKNGLIYGTSDTTISPDANISRAQMAAIIVRAFGATKEADISAYADVNSGKWYYKELAKAVQMGAFSGVSETEMNPDGEITFEECFTVLSRVFGLNITTTEEDALTALGAYEDGSQVAKWAVVYYGSLVKNGYWTGGEKKLLTPKTCITRGEFAVVMDNLVTTYISDAEGLTEYPTSGNILVRCDGVSLDKLELEGDLIVGDGVSANGVSLNDINIKGRLVVRGCAAEEPIKEPEGGISVSGNDDDTQTIEITCSPTGFAEYIQIINPYIYFNASGIERGKSKIYGVKNSMIYMGSIGV